jgi:hypothetical protein
MPCLSLVWLAGLIQKEEARPFDAVLVFVQYFHLVIYLRAKTRRDDHEENKSEVIGITKSFGIVKLSLWNLLTHIDAAGLQSVGRLGCFECSNDFIHDILRDLPRCTRNQFEKQTLCTNVYVNLLGK